MSHSISKCLPGLLLLACQSPPPEPLFMLGALAATSVGDRELVVMSGDIDLRALQLCGSSASCAGDSQLAPGRVPLVNNTFFQDPPLRLTGARVLRPDTGANAGVLVATNGSLYMGIIDAESFLIDGASEPMLGTYDGIATDVIAVNEVDPATGLPRSAAAVTVFAATLANQFAPAEVEALTVQRGPHGELPPPVLAGRCSFDAGVRAGRIAAVFGSDIFVADLAGGGVLRVARESVTSAFGPCSVTRIAAPIKGDPNPPVISLDLSPQWYETVGGAPVVHPAGELLMMVVSSSVDFGVAGTVVPATGPISSGVLFFDVATGAIAPVPPFRLDGSDGSPEPMQAISPLGRLGQVQEARFLRATPPGADCPQAPCTPLDVGSQGIPQLERFELLAAVDQGLFIDVLHRRAVDPRFYALAADPHALDPQVVTVAPLTPATDDPNPPVLAFALPEPGVPGHEVLGWMQPGVTQSARWDVSWHGMLSAFPTGTLTPSGHGTTFYDSDGLAAPAADPVLHFGPGDLVSFLNIFLIDHSDPCLAVLKVETSNRFQARVISIEGTRAELATPPDFNPGGACASLHADAELFVAGEEPWLVERSFQVFGRAPHGKQFVSHAPRFDYPNAYTTENPPVQSLDIELAFTVTGDEPTVQGATFSFTLDTGLAPVIDQAPPNISASVQNLFAYSSAAHPNLIFSLVRSSSSGALIQTTPDQPGGGLKIFK